MAGRKPRGARPALPACSPFWPRPLTRARFPWPKERENLEDELYTREEELAARDEEMQVAAEVGRALAEEREKAAREAKSLTRTNSNLVSQVRQRAPPRCWPRGSRDACQRDKLQSLLDIERRHSERRAEKQAVRRPLHTLWPAAGPHVQRVTRKARRSWSGSWRPSPGRCSTSERTERRRSTRWRRHRERRRG